MIAPAPAPTAPPITAPSTARLGELWQPTQEKTTITDNKTAKIFLIFYASLNLSVFLYPEL
jgi:hypothetical protein